MCSFFLLPLLRLLASSSSNFSFRFLFFSFRVWCGMCLSSFVFNSLNLSVGFFFFSITIHNIILSYFILHVIIQSFSNSLYEKYVSVRKRTKPNWMHEKKLTILKKITHQIVPVFLFQKFSFQNNKIDEKPKKKWKGKKLNLRCNLQLNNCPPQKIEWEIHTKYTRIQVQNVWA